MTYGSQNNGINHNSLTKDSETQGTIKGKITRWTRTWCERRWANEQGNNGGRDTTTRTTSKWRAVKTKPRTQHNNTPHEHRDNKDTGDQTRDPTVPRSQERHQVPQEEAHLIADGSPRSTNGPKCPGTAPSISPLDHSPPSPRDTETPCHDAARRVIS